ncbi:MAG: 23S rRNA (uracil(1939)-C(5))-methyltransferase RlmD [Lachnospiraceae bacterium]|nr:23S rRNA (uracil(1939)-C(5))-methyltransferase RlmD [Lachnospiraceae bacterium]
MKKGDTIEGYVTKYDFPNIGHVTVEEDGEIFDIKIKNAIIGQKVRGVINKKKHGLLEARLGEILERSPEETAIPCPHFRECGGCTYQTFPYKSQLKIKEKQILDMLKKSLGENAADIDEAYEGILGSIDESEYRNKMEFSFGDEYKGGPLALGMHKRGSTYDVVNTFECNIVDEDYRSILRVTKEFFEKYNLPFFHKMTHEGVLRHLCVRKGRKTGEILVFLVTSSQWINYFDEEKWTAVLNDWKNSLLNIKTKGTFAGILHVNNDCLADAVRDEGKIILYGRDYFEEELLGLRFKISLFSFFQNNSLAAEILYSKVKDYLLFDVSNKPVVYDLYTGTGTIAQLISGATSKTVGVEIVEEAVAAARESAERNGISNCEFIAGDVLKCLDDIKVLPDYIILDPPRDGINPKALEKILNYGVKRIVYVSCKPSSLARDLSFFYDKGYMIKKLCLTDLFPSTYHCETVCMLEYTGE